MVPESFLRFDQKEKAAEKERRKENEDLTGNRKAEEPVNHPLLAFPV